MQCVYERLKIDVSQTYFAAARVVRFVTTKIEKCHCRRIRNLAMSVSLHARARPRTWIVLRDR